MPRESSNKDPATTAPVCKIEDNLLSGFEFEN
jgi:hypothetical protein